MTSDAAPAVLLGVVCGAGVAGAWLRVRRGHVPEQLMRVNVSGRRVPAVLGGPLVAGCLVALAVLQTAAAMGWDDARAGTASAAVALAVVAMAAAGRFDDLRGDEPARGFRGHLSARRMTGGIVKIVAGGLSGLAAGAILAGGSEPLFVIETAALVALAANLLNLLDRAPGRAAKAWFLGALPLIVAGAPAWGIAAAGLLGASFVCAVPDLAERGMLGDAGANPLGAALGVGIALSLDRPGRVAVVILLLALNAVSERISFSRVIERTPFLSAVDRLGRK